MNFARELFMLAVVISQPSACSSTAPYFEAASEAGFPETVRLLEEPQAAFQLIPREMIIAYAILKKAAANANHSSKRRRKRAASMECLYRKPNQASRLSRCQCA
jgi:hypothetical protein